MSFTTKQQRFVEEYPVDFNATQAAIRAGYSERTAYSIGQENLNKPEIADAIKERVSTLQMTADEAAIRMAKAARFDIGQYLEGAGRQAWLNVERLRADGWGWIIKGVKYTSSGAPIYELWDGQRALEKIFDAGNPAVGDPERPLTIAVIKMDMDEL